MKSKLLLILLFSYSIIQLLPTVGNSQTYIDSGYVAGKWVKKNSPYYIKGTITVPANDSLVISMGLSIHEMRHGGQFARGEARDEVSAYKAQYSFDGELGYRSANYFNGKPFSELESFMATGNENMIPIILITNIGQINQAMVKDIGEKNKQEK